MLYLITSLGNLDYSDMWYTPIETSIVTGHKNAMKIFIKHLELTTLNEQGFECSCDKCYHFIMEHEENDEENIYIDFNTLYSKYLNSEYICDECQDDFCDKGTEVIKYLTEIYNETVDGELSLTMSLQDINKIYVKCINNTNDVKMSFDVLDDNDELL